ncbi:hypothetical protein [Thermogemmatispora sp.]|uniref:hypothetical protein n=1 Tax=Thermogemmatispora sp. TaxID=1968838 RepID=UPI001D83D464|nr:hypothetical protein [Thermogemmatispora sp.]MBX5450605.1 hypothetical protein [Thermogemmatispora sp.]
MADSAGQALPAQASGYCLASNMTFYEVEKRYFEFEVRKNVASIVLVKRIAVALRLMLPHVSIMPSPIAPFPK